jgi:hypothetical protein
MPMLAGGQGDTGHNPAHFACLASIASPRMRAKIPHFRSLAAAFNACIGEAVM